MQDEFIFWISGVFEDTPLPHEISNIYFCLHTDNNAKFLSFGGNEQKLKKLVSFEFYPLEAQFFPIKNYETFSLFSLRKLLENSCNKSKFITEFQNKTIFYGTFGSNNIYKLEC